MTERDPHELSQALESETDALERHGQEVKDAVDETLDILASALGREGTGRLYKILVHEKQWAQNVAAFIHRGDAAMKGAPM